MYNWMDDFVNNTDFSQNKPLKDVVYESIRTTIIEGKIPAGERFIEKEYSQRLNISRTPVREALKQLESEGLVEYVPRIGAVVKRITKEDAIEIYKIRHSLELLVITSVMENITENEINEISELLTYTKKVYDEGKIDETVDLFKEYNNLIYKISRMKRLPMMISNLNSYFTKFRSISFEREGRMELALKDHKDQLESIILKDVDMASQIIKRHLDNSLEIVLSEIE